MSGSESGSVSDGELEFRCRKCPGKTFTAAEKDAHRTWHREQKGGRPKIGPKSRLRMRASRGRSPSPVASAVTLFEPVEQPKATRRKAPDAGKPSNPSKKQKKKSKKNYDGSILGGWSRGSGA